MEPTIISVFNFIKYPERIKKWLSGKYKFRNVHDNIYAVPAHTLEHILASVRFGLLKFINRKLIRNQITKCIMKIDPQILKTVLVLHRPEMHFLINHLNESGAVFDCCDDYTLTSNMKSLKVLGNKEREKILSQNCRFVITTSMKLYRRNKEYNQNTYLIENGYEYNDVQDISADIDLYMNKIKKPIIGYIGNVRDWIDFELLDYLFSKYRDYSFVFFGAVNKNSAVMFNSLLRRYDNVISTGRIKYSNYIQYFKYIDAGIIPFQVNEFMESVNPNKFYELLGAGIPVVATQMGDLEEKYSDIAWVGKTKEEFSMHLEKIISLSENDKKILRLKILKEAGKHTWNQKAEFFHELLNRHIG